VVERAGLVEIDIEAGEVRERHNIPGAGFPNDVAADGAGRLYVTDSRASAIRRFEDGAFTVWMSGGEIRDPNAIMIEDGTLYLGNNGDGSLKSIDIDTREASTLARFREGNIDGIKRAEDGSLLVSHWEGRVYRVSDDGETEKLIDTSVTGRYAADFEYVGSKNMVVLPAFYADEVIGYTLGE
jgi:sugar lactone lactonase YvrE